ncbi:MAG: hypothetical protein ABT01_03120 [Clostridium sp. SCN 57-10]|nr:MAG: hypothetical protein ABT01_03120 [Clostridium sp. SCN 57-10]
MKIIGDSCCDLNGLGELPVDIAIVPLKITINGRTLIDRDIDTHELVREIAESPVIAATACPSPADFADAMSGDDDCFVVTLSSQLSGTYQSAMLGAEMKTGKGRVYVIDSKSASAGETAIVLELIRLHGLGISFPEMCVQIEAFVSGMSTLFVLNTLDTLIKAGRMKKLVGQVASILHLRPIMQGEGGKIGLLEKARGTQNAMVKLSDIVAERAAEQQGVRETLVITECHCRERAEDLRRMIMDKCRAIKRVFIISMGGLSTVYANDGGIIIGY